jgi:hypothetical protein
MSSSSPWATSRRCDAYPQGAGGRIVNFSGDGYRGCGVPAADQQPGRPGRPELMTAYSGAVVRNYSAVAARSSELAACVTNRTRTFAANAPDEPGLGAAIANDGSAAALIRIRRFAVVGVESCGRRATGGTRRDHDRCYQCSRCTLQHGLSSSLTDSPGSRSSICRSGRVNPTSGGNQRQCPKRRQHSGPLGGNRAGARG